MRTRRIPTTALARVVTLAVITPALMLSVLVGIAAATPLKATFAQPYPWSRTAAPTTGDYVADSYNGVGADNVFENVTTDRLLDILSSNGTYYIVFSGPEHATGQTALAAINEQAKADGITKIYHYDPYVDGFQLDITDVTPGGVGSWLGGTSVNYGGTSTVNETWRLITDHLPASTITTGGALYGYRGDQLLLLSVTISDRTNVATGVTINGSYRLRPAGVPSFNEAFARPAISAVFHKGPAGAVIPSSERTQFAFFQRLYRASASSFNSGTVTPDRIGGPVDIFTDADFPGGDGFVLKAIDIKQLYNLLNSPGEHAILFAGQGCHNTQAIIGSVAKRAKELGLSTVYVADFALNSNVKFGTGSDIDTATVVSATGGLWIRAGATSTKNKFSYLYAELTKYFGNWVTENSSKKNNSIAYYPNGDIDSTLTTDPYVSLGGGVYGDNPNLGDNVPNARRLQVPFLIAYNKDAAEPVTHQWLHLNQASTETTKVYTEYMLELAWVRQTQAAVDSTSVVVDGLKKVEFASEAVAALDNVLVPVKNYVAAYSAAPVPTVTGSAKVGQTLAAVTGTWFPAPDFAYQWYAGGVPIVSATASTYRVSAAVVGKAISVKVTASKPGFPTVSRTSKLSAIVTGTFTKSPLPTISGTARVGRVLKASTGIWAPAPSFTYQWYANGVKITGATKSYVTLTKAQLGKRITVKVTARRAYYTTIIRTSLATAKVTN